MCFSSLSFFRFFSVGFVVLSSIGHKSLNLLDLTLHPTVLQQRLQQHLMAQ